MLFGLSIGYLIFAFLSQKRIRHCISKLSFFIVINLVLVQKLQDNGNESLNLGHTDITTLQKGRDRYGNEKYVQVEALSAWHYFVNSEMVPAVQLELS